MRLDGTMALITANAPSHDYLTSRLQGGCFSCSDGHRLQTPSRVVASFSPTTRGIPPEDCAGTANHGTVLIGGYVSLPPVIFAVLHSSHPAVVQATLLAHLRLTHHAAKLERYALAPGKLVSTLLREP